METTPKASGCFSGGTREIFGRVSEDFFGGDGKAEAAKIWYGALIRKLRR
jgi:hypothetical protein